MQSRRRIGIGIHTVNAFYRGVLSGVARYSHHQSQWHTVFINPHNTSTTRKTLKEVSGIITCIDDWKWCDALLEAGLPVVNVDAALPNLPIPRLNVDNIPLGKMAAEHFIERGLMSFAFVGHKQMFFSQNREATFRAALEAKGYELAVYNVHGKGPVGPISWFHSLDLGLADWLRSLPRPTGLLAPYDHWGAEILETCRQAGLRVPEDVAILGVDNDHLFCSMTEPPLSSVMLPTEAIGMEAGRQLDLMIDENQTALTEDILLSPIGIATRKSTDIYAIDDSEVALALRFIRDNLHRPIQVKDILQKASVSRRGLERKFFNVLGETVGATIRRSRLNLAKQLLIETDLPVGKVASRAGYTDIRQMELIFQKEVKSTPSQFRKKIAIENRSL